SAVAAAPVAVDREREVRRRGGAADPAGRYGLSRSFDGGTASGGRGSRDSGFGGGSAADLDEGVRRRHRFCAGRPCAAQQRPGDRWRVRRPVQGRGGEGGGRGCVEVGGGVGARAGRVEFSRGGGGDG